MGNLEPAGWCHVAFPCLHLGSRVGVVGTLRFPLLLPSLAGLAYAAHPAVLPSSSQNSLRIFLCSSSSLPLASVAPPASELPFGCLLLGAHSGPSNALDGSTVPDFLIIFCSNYPCCVYTKRRSDNVFVALCGSFEPNVWNESGIEYAAFSLFVSDFRIDGCSKW